MNEFKIYLITLFEKTKENLKDVSKESNKIFKEIKSKVQFNVNKQLTIKTMYDPMVKNKIDSNMSLKEQYNKLKEQNENIKSQIISLEHDNSMKEQDISCLYELLSHSQDTY